IQQAFAGGATFGGLWAPRRTPVRFGAKLRTPMQTPELANGTALRLPFEAGVGMAAMVGGTNVRGAYGPRWTERRPGRDRWLLDVDLVFTGGGGGAVALLPLATEGVEQVVGGPTLRVRGGLEWASLNDRLRLRGGVATVPGRGADGGVRFGLGGGFELFRVLGTSYRAAGYVGWGPEGWSGGVGVETW
ncbi:MAG: hypothetical protein AAF602_22000, partial [Myxococcota bacterium]